MLVLSSCLLAYGDEANAPTSTNTPQSYATATVKTNWMDAKVTLYRAMGRAVQLDAKLEFVTLIYGPHTNDVNILAFDDPETGNAWLGSSEVIQPKFYLETESGIVRGTVVFARMALGGFRPDEHDVSTNGVMAYGEVHWDRSVFPRVKRGENVDAVIEQFDKNNGLKLMAKPMFPQKTTVIENSLQRIENGLNPWFFVDERQGSQSVTTIQAIDVSDGKLRLNLINPTGSHKASVWIDLKTWQVVKTIQDGMP
jgi:hypothetical protein